jgi:peptidyl-prolyl cis-trans isomerase C
VAETLAAHAKLIFHPKSCMKSITILLFTGAVWAQAVTTAPKPSEPGASTAPKAAAPATPGQTMPGQTMPGQTLPPDTVLATIEGRKLTYAEFQKYMAALPPQMQQSAMKDRKGFVEQFALMQKLSQLAEKSELDQKSPYRESLEFNRMYVLMNAELNDAMNKIIVSGDEQQKQYDEHKDKYSQARVKVIYIPFSSSAAAQADSKGKKLLSEPEAKARAEQALADARGGADFVKLVKQYSEDATSAAKDGDFGTIHRSDNVPEPIKTAVFGAKPGQVTDPIRQPNGYYLFRVEDVSVRPYSEVRDEIYNEIRQARYKEWLDSMRGGVKVTLENEAFFSQAPAPAPPSLASPVRK